MPEMNIKQKLMLIQAELKAPKNLYNSFGKYHYRNAEGICEAVKPLLKKYKAALTISDEIVEVGGRIYVKSTATLEDVETEMKTTFDAQGLCVTQSSKIEISAYAREASEKKGMDDAQVTGATSSYARKYALNGLFLLDDTKDVDSEEYQAETKKATAKKPKADSDPAPSRSLLRVFCQENNIEPSRIVKACNLNPNSTEQEWAAALEYAKKTFGG